MNTITDPYLRPEDRDHILIKEIKLYLAVKQDMQYGRVIDAIYQLIKEREDLISTMDNLVDAAEDFKFVFTDGKQGELDFSQNFKYEMLDAAIKDCKDFFAQKNINMTMEQSA